MTCRSRLGIGCCKVSAGVVVDKHFDRCCGKGGGAALEGGSGGIDGGGNGNATLGDGCCCLIGIVCWRIVHQAWDHVMVVHLVVCVVGKDGLCCGQLMSG